MKFLPLWIAKFLPMNSGTIVQARAQVLIGSRLPDWSARYTRSSNRSTTYGPFFSERPMGLSSSRSFPFPRKAEPADVPRGATGRRRATPRLTRRRRGGTSDLQLAIADAAASADDRRVRRLAATTGLAPLRQLPRGGAGV